MQLATFACQTFFKTKLLVWILYTDFFDVNLGKS